MSSAPIDQSIAFGTDGIRGNADHFPFADQALTALGRACAAWAQEKYGKKRPKMLIGADTRISGPRIKQALAAGLLAGGVDVWDGGVIPTPAVCQLIMLDSSFDAGIVISASHNPFHDNGIKIFDSRRCKISPEDEQKITQLFGVFLAETGSDTRSHPSMLRQSSAQAPSTGWLEAPLVLSRVEGSGRTDSTHTDLACGGEPLPVRGEPVEPYERIQKKSVIDWSAEAAAAYERCMLSRFQTGFLKNIKVVLDCANGATSAVAPAIFRALGATVETIAGHPDGKNINAKCGALHPERLIDAVRLSKADAGFAFDGDGDRLIVVTRQGVVKDGDEVLDLLLDLPAFKGLAMVVGTVMTNQGFERHLEAEGRRLLRTRVGDKFVVAKMEEEGLPLGGEISGHTIIHGYLPTSDGILVALKVMESVMLHNNWDMQTFAKFPQVLVNVPVAQKKELAQQPFATLIADAERFLADGRLVVRYSGTENLLRVMAEAPTQELAQSVANDLAHVLQDALQKA
jgi:phosphoglucosamine mutase